jgi:hypothetical protein
MVIKHFPLLELARDGIQASSPLSTETLNADERNEDR